VFWPPQKVTTHTSHAITRLAKQNCRKPYHKIGKSVIPRVSASSVQRVLAEKGMHQRKAGKAVFLTKKHKASQKQWAGKYKHWSMDDWAHVIWSNECYMYIGDGWELSGLQGRWMRHGMMTVV